MDHEEDTSIDTGEIECREEQEPIVSAAKMAGESGGISCSSASTGILFFVIMFSAAIITTRFRIS